MSDFAERRALLEQAGLNVFGFPAHKIPGCDLLSDSGTTTMTMEQWSELLLGDEAYGSNQGYYELKDQLARTFGLDWQTAQRCQESTFLFHQGRAAEHALASVLARELLPRVALKDAAAMVERLEPELRTQVLRKIRQPTQGFLIVPSNSHFDTTEGNFEAANIVPLNLPCAEHRQRDKGFEFRGNIDVDALSRLLDSCRPLVPLVYLTITNNTGGGQPVSMDNIRAVADLARTHDLPFFFDACRFAENAWFIKQREPGHRSRTIPEIVHEMFRYADGFHISFKKDGLANIGGALVVKPGARFETRFPALLGLLTDHQIMVEGHPTYGGLAGRDLKAIAQGLRTVVDERYLACRTGQVQRFGARLAAHGVPIVEPVGGSAVYIEMDELFGKKPGFRGISFTALLLLAGHRFCELGAYAFGRFRDGHEIGPDPRVNNVRAAVPRLTYEDQDLFSAAEAARVLLEHRDRIPDVRVTFGQDLGLRHFKSRFEFCEV
jgi:tryptophanase